MRRPHTFALLAARFANPCLARALHAATAKDVPVGLLINFRVAVLKDGIRRLVL